MENSVGRPLRDPFGQQWMLSQRIELADEAEMDRHAKDSSIRRRDTHPQAGLSSSCDHDGVTSDDEHRAHRRSLRSVVLARLRSGVLIVITLLVVEYFVVPELVGASKNIDELRNVNVGWLVGGLALEVAALLAYALLMRTLLARTRPPLFQLFRIVLATTGISHVIPAGSVGGAGLGYRLLTTSGVDGTDAAFVLGSQAIISAIVLNVVLWLALLVSIPLAGVHPIYVVIALVGVIALFAVSALLYTFTRGEEQAVRAVRAVGRRLPRVGADRLEAIVRHTSESVGHLAHDRLVLRRASGWAALNWLLDAASLWAFLAAFGHFIDPIKLFAAYGIANVLGAIPVVPGGLGIIEASAASLLVSFGVPRVTATLGVLGWRLVNFWLPIPAGAAAYVSLSLPRGSRLRQARRAVAEMSEAPKSSDPPPQEDPPADQ
jgi:hypothetical protein